MTKPHWYAPFKGSFTPIANGPEEGPFLCVNFNIDYAPFIRGALFALLQRQMWEGSTSEVDAMIVKVHQLLYIFGQLTDCPLTDEGGEGFEVMSSLCESLRIEDGRLQALCCGEWVDIPGQLPGNGVEQPGDGSPQPEPGECQSYHAALSANGQWLLPSVVNAGDVLTFSNSHGAATDGSGSGIWYCPNGGIFFAGSCTGVYNTSGSDPMPTAAHMGLIAQINGVYYDTQAPITVPGGVVNKPVVFMVNDVVPSDNAGGYTFDVEKCNNQAASWSHLLDLALDPEGFTLYLDTFWTPSSAGVWTLGSGFTDTGGTASGDTKEGVEIERLFATPFTLTDLRYDYDLAKGTVNAGLSDLVAVQLAGVNQAITTTAADTNADGTGKSQSIPHGTYSVDRILIQVRTAFYTSGVNGSGRVFRIFVAGVGPDPFV